MTEARRYILDTDAFERDKAKELPQILYIIQYLKSKISGETYKSFPEEVKKYLKLEE